MNRQRLIGAFLSEASTSEPWVNVYRLLLWIDKTTGLAHCYESDKCQPGKPWYPRSLRFHQWLSQTLGQPPRTVGDGIDWLFRHVAEDFAHLTVERFQQVLHRATTQRAAFDEHDFPEPGDDPGIVEIVREVLGGHLAEEPSLDEWRTLTQRIRELVSVENKRKNLVGEGFEDVLAAVIRDADRAGTIDAWPRRLLREVPGFGNVRSDEKPNKVDLVVIRRADTHRTLITVKWSIRADRESQFRSDLVSYVNARSDQRPFDYVLVTNEFDPARLIRACETAATSDFMFRTVVHINPDALLATYGPSREPSMSRVLELIASGRIIGLDQWLRRLVP